MKATLTSVEAAREAMLNAVTPIKARETLSLLDAQHRVLAKKYTAAINVPPADNSAMDGYAINSAATYPGCQLQVSQEITAGALAQPLEAGTAARIFTGAEIPDGADAVIIQEDCQRHGDTVTLLAEVKSGENVRPKGQDINAGSLLFMAGHYLRPQDLGLLASANIAQVEVFKPLRVALLSTGNELLEPGSAPAPGKIFNSNRYLLIGLLRSMNCDVIDGGIVADTLDTTRSALQQAVAQADVIVTSGGVSVGDADYVKTAVNELGQISLWKINVKPGKPLAFGHINGKPFVGLPGNPVSAFVSFHLLLRPLLCKLQGRTSTGLTEPIALPALFSLPAPRKRCEYLRGRITATGVEIYPEQSSGALSSVVWANCLVRVDEGMCVEKNDLVKVYPLYDC